MEMSRANCVLNGFNGQVVGRGWGLTPAEGGNLVWFSGDSVGVVESESSEAYGSGLCALEIK